MDAVRQVGDSMRQVAVRIDLKGYLYGLIFLFLIMYAGLAAPELPDNVLRWFRHPAVAVMMMASALLLRNYNPYLAIIIAVLFVVLISYATYRSHNALQEPQPVPQVSSRPEEQLGLLEDASQSNRLPPFNTFLGTPLHPREPTRFQGPQGTNRRPTGLEKSAIVGACDMATIGQQFSQL
jgi:membrane protein implicated in regulation of membrane protease activity